MGSPNKDPNKGFFAAMTSDLSLFGNAEHRSVNGYGMLLIPRKTDKFQFTYFAHKINSFDTAPKKLQGAMEQKKLQNKICDPSRSKAH